MGEADIINNIFSEAIRSLRGEGTEDNLNDSAISDEENSESNNNIEQDAPVPEKAGADLQDMADFNGIADESESAEDDNGQYGEALAEEVVNNDLEFSVDNNSPFNDDAGAVVAGGNTEGAGGTEIVSVLSDDGAIDGISTQDGELRKENDVPEKGDNWDENMDDSATFADGGVDSDDDDLDTLLSELANSAAACNDAADESEDDFPEYSDNEEESSSAGESLDDLLEGALGLQDTPDSDAESDDFADDAGSGKHRMMVEPSIATDETDDALEDLFNRAASEDEFSDADADFDFDGSMPAEDGPAIAGDMFEEFSEETESLNDQEDGDMPHLDDGGATPSFDVDEMSDDDSAVDIVTTVPVPESSIEISEDTSDDEELQRRLAEIGLGDDALLHNSFSSEKEKLLRHLEGRFEYIARKKLEKLADDHIPLIKTVNLKVEIDLKFGEFSASGDDDSLFNIDF